jgi:hypothetical protein
MAMEEPIATVTPFMTVWVGALVGAGPELGVGRAMVVPGAMIWEGLMVNTLPLAVIAVVPAWGLRVILPIMTELPERMTGTLFAVTVGEEGLLGV